VRANRYLVIAVSAIFAMALVWATTAAAAPLELPTTAAAEDQVTAEEPAAAEDDAATETPSDDPGSSDGADRGGDEEEASDASVTEAQSGDGDVKSETVKSAGDDRNCDDFEFQEDAQDYFEDHGGSADNNVDVLDRDRDGVACQNLPSRNAPTGGIDSGGGGTAPAPDSGPVGPVPFTLGGAVIGLLVALLGPSLRRRETV
jgi:hypothetical protein